MDLAPLCLFRIVYGILLFNWVWELWPNIPAFFTDEGTLPRTLLLQSWPSFSLLLLTGDAWGAWLLWTAGLATAVALSVGYRTRLASIAAFVIVVSFTDRAPYTLDASDFVFRMIPFWLIFTAAGNRYSVDALLSERRGERPKTRGPALPVRLLEAQIAWIYLASGLEKAEGTQWVDGTAVYYALQLKYTVGRWYADPLAHNFWIVHFTTWGTLAIELAFLPLVFAPFVQRYTRPLAALLAAAVHCGILLLLNVGNFPLIMLATLIPFCSSVAVERFVHAVEGVVRRGGPKWLAEPASASALTAAPVEQPLQLSLFGDLRSESSSGAMRVDSSSMRLQHRLWWRSRLLATLHRFGRAAAQVLLAALAVAAFATALPDAAQDYRPKDVLLQFVSYAGLDQNWGMFAPDPANADGWLVAPGQLADGSSIDLTGPSASMDTPRFADQTYSRWTKVTEWLANRPSSEFVLEYARSYCRLRNWHLQPGESPLVKFDLIYVQRVIPAPGEPVPPLSRRLLWSHVC